MNPFNFIRESPYLSFLEQVGITWVSVPMCPPYPGLWRSLDLRSLLHHPSHNRHPVCGSCVRHPPTAAVRGPRAGFSPAPSTTRPTAQGSNFLQQRETVGWGLDRAMQRCWRSFKLFLNINIIHAYSKHIHDKSLKNTLLKWRGEKRDVQHEQKFVYNLTSIKSLVFHINDQLGSALLLLDKYYID